MATWMTRRTWEMTLLQHRVQILEQAQALMEERLSRHQQRLDALMAQVPAPPMEEEADHDGS